MNSFQAKIGPPRILAGILAIGYAVVNISIAMITRGEFVPWRHMDEILALAFGALNLVQELILSNFRNRILIVEMNEHGLFDRRIMYERLAWDDIEWIEPHPGGVADRLRVKAQVRLTPFGAVRNRLLQLVRHIPEGEVVITFGGLNKAAAQAAAWLADYQPRLIPDVWKIATVRHEGALPTNHQDICLRAHVYPRAWLSYLIGGVILLAVLIALLPTFAVPSLVQGRIPTDIAQLALLGMILGILIVGGLVTLQIYLRLSSTRAGVIVLSQTGLTDIRISSQFIPWNQIDHVTFHWLNTGRLVNESVAVEVQLQEGFQLKPPEGLIFKLAHYWRKATTPELFTLVHSGTTTSVSEIIDHIERHKLPVAVREIARN
ncbi:hypothetical protein [Aquidulcibacter sp.]|uniref:hypothetical protein n=1 Tax=Aquidulcibacter sp. TaxID=2052990 RepID=UPI0025C1C16B|nr:hypothetical protein [Aquidulcibacter sp.]MCA3695601.1 hypothetical protein [Aquidulcibacter sp.]